MKMRFWMMGFALLAMPMTGQGGALRTQIRLSHSIPEMEASAAWAKPDFAITPASGAQPASPGSVLYGETVSLRQLAATLRTQLLLAGPTPVQVPAGTLFSVWWVGGDRQACTSAATEATHLDKPAYQLCLVSRHGAAMDTAIIRKLGDRLAEATTTPLAEPVTLSLIKSQPADQGFAWPRAHVFSYRQDGGVGIIRDYGRTLLAPELAYDRRIVVRKLEGSTLTLRCESAMRENLSEPLAAQTPSFFKVQEASIDLNGGTGEADLCGSRLAIRRTGDGQLTASAQAPFAPWWSIDEHTHRFQLGEEPFVYGAQAD